MNQKEDKKIYKKNINSMKRFLFKENTNKKVTKNKDERSI